MKKYHPYQIYGFFVALFVLIGLVMPANTATVEQYDLSLASYRILLLTVSMLPAILTWLAAVYGFVQLKQYATTIAKTREGKSFANLTTGVGWMALSLPILGTIYWALTAIANAHPGFESTAAILMNYIAVATAVIAASWLSSGARQMTELTKTRPHLWVIRLASLLFIIMGLFYSYTLITHAQQSPNPYHMPLGLLLTTVAAPFLYAWFLGMLAVMDINAYSATTAGFIYRKALSYFNSGIIMIVSSTIMLQFMNSASTTRGRLLLGNVLVMRYVLYAITAVGFMFIAKSAKKLQQIENI